MRDPRYDILFEPVKIGPVTVKNRFYQVPHCNGLSATLPRGHAAMRGVKAEGGWGAVCTDILSIHPSSDTTPFPQNKLWESGDEKPLRLLTDAIHEHGALAGAQLAHGGWAVANRLTREPLLSPTDFPSRRDPIQAKAMDKADIKAYRGWHRRAALKAKEVGFDLIYVYAADDLELLQFFLSRRRNHRIDEYGGSLENRTRLLREVIEDTKDAVGDKCGVVVRYTVDELSGPDGLVAEEEGRDIVAMLAELPDAWDIKVSGWPEDSQTSRFAKEGYQEPYAKYVKQVTTKPVIGVGRFTSPDTMVSQVKRGILDLIGSARPSIADPFLPRKIDEGRLDDIRECIGCNMCVATYNVGAPINCTQNPTIGEEYKRGWHPERYRRAKSDASVLVIGAGPAGLECAQALGNRGYEVHLAEATRELGGRVTRESSLNGLSEWARVRDWRVGQLAKMTNVSIYRESRMTGADILEMGIPTVVIATGASWRSDGFGRTNHKAVPVGQGVRIFTPDDVMSGAQIDGPVLVFDDDDFYMGGVVAETLKARGAGSVSLATPNAMVSAWTANTLEQFKIQRRLLEAGVELHVTRNLVSASSGEVELECVFTKRRQKVQAASIVMVTARLPEITLYDEILVQLGSEPGAAVKAITRIGDCITPGTIAAAVFSGRRFAEEFEEPQADMLRIANEPVEIDNVERFHSRHEDRTVAAFPF
ncbi:FAD-dependent oxidoreductase [Labrys okinawensis]|uniref:oxidoreductase n=1 Tax=Labrys okinawensis TaxID=346911 RepID=UPI0039BD614D